MRSSGIASLLLATALMTSAAARKDFTVDDLISAPRPQPPIPDAQGTQAISVVDQWSPEHDKTTRTVYLVALDTKGKAPVELFSCPPGQAGEFFWLSDDTTAYLNGSTLYSLETKVSTQAVKRTHILDFPEGISASGLQYESKSGYLGFTAQLWQHGDGSFEGVEKLNEKFERRGDTGQVYDDLFIRHWDTWRVSGKVWTVGLTKIHKGINGFVEKPQVFVNLLNDTDLYNQMDPPTFALSHSHLALSVKAPHLNNAMHTREDVYVIDLSRLHAIKPSHLTPHAHGAISGLTFSPDGSKLAWLEMAEDGYESDRRVAVVHDTKKAVRWTDTWDRSPSSITWSLDSSSLYLLAEHEGRVLPYHLSEAGHLPSPLVFNHTTTSILALPKQLLLSITSHTSPIDYFLLADTADTEAAKLHRLTAFSDKHIDGKLDGLEGEEFWFTGDAGYKVMGWANKPPGWKAGEKRKWPMAFLIHGGPQGAWEDSWSTRWNQAMFAAKGYFVIAINPTGSTGYGQEFTDRIQGEWGSRPYRDLVAGYQAALDLYPEIDPDRTAALGASYGGYMINWLNGHNPGFKAMVCHDGIFSTTDAFYTTEELWFPLHENMGSPIDNRQLYEKWNPANHVAEWSTPTLVIHSGKDFRLIDGAGIAAFTALQYQGVPSRFLYFPDENHWVLKPGNSRRWHHEVFRWLDEWVGHGEKEPSVDQALVLQG